MSRLLALDVGERRIGVAVADSRGRIAGPLATIRRASKEEDFARIATAIREQGAAVVVVGFPLNEDDSAGPQARRVERYAAAMAEALRAMEIEVPVVLWDEHGSTVRAQEAMIASGRRAKNRRSRIDAAAAAVILQDYLDARRDDGKQD